MALGVPAACLPEPCPGLPQRAGARGGSAGAPGCGFATAPSPARHPESRLLPRGPGRACPARCPPLPIAGAWGRTSRGPGLLKGWGVGPRLRWGPPGCGFATAPSPARHPESRLLPRGPGRACPARCLLSRRGGAAARAPRTSLGPGSLRARKIARRCGLPQLRLPPAGARRDPRSLLYRQAGVPAACSRA